MEAELTTETVVWLGKAVGAIAQCTEPLQWSWIERDWTMLPHPSGLNRWYNVDTNRRCAETMLGDLLGGL
jgi:hypothetical protein